MVGSMAGEVSGRSVRKGYGESLQNKPKALTREKSIRNWICEHWAPGILRACYKENSVRSQQTPCSTACRCQAAGHNIRILDILTLAYRKPESQADENGARDTIHDDLRLPGLFQPFPEKARRPGDDTKDQQSCNNEDSTKRHHLNCY